MRNKYHFLTSILMLTSLSVRAQNYSAIVGLTLYEPKPAPTRTANIQEKFYSYNKSSMFIPDSTGNNQVSIEYSQIDNTGRATGSEFHNIFIRFINIDSPNPFDGGFPQMSSILEKVVISRDGKQPLTFQPKTPNQLKLDYFFIYLSGREYNDFFKDIKVGDVIHIRIYTKDGIQPLAEGEDFSYTYFNKWEKYKGFGEDWGMWLPAAQFGSNLMATDNGIPFASVPLGIAWGWKTNKIKKKNHKVGYTGFSIAANWVVYPEDKETEEGRTVNFKTLSLGLLFDFGNNITIGGQYGFDLRKDNDDPGFIFVIGFAPKLLDLLKSP